MNALKHGLRSDAILLPGDDAAEFHRLRADLYATYRPLTGEEARCVERIAGLQWRMARCVRWEAIFDDKLDALLHDADGAAAERSDPDPHRWQHRGDDCGRREHRMDIALNRAEQRLYVLQRQRRNGLLLGAAKQAQDPAALLAAHSPVPTQAAQAQQAVQGPPEPIAARVPATETAAETAAAPVRGAPSFDTGNGIRNERERPTTQGSPFALRVPLHPLAHDPRYPGGVDIIAPVSYGKESYGEESDGKASCGAASLAAGVSSATPVSFATRVSSATLGAPFQNPV